MRQVLALLQPIVARMRLMINRGVLELTDDANGMQRVQISGLADEVLSDVERFQQYGFTSVPLPKAEVIFVSLGGRRTHAVVVSADHPQFRKKGMQPGEVALYTDEGDFIHFKRGRTIEIEAGTKVKVTAPNVEVVAAVKVLLTAPLVECSAALKANGPITGLGGMAISGGSGATVTGNLAVTSGEVSADGIGLKSHHHGGVQTGGGNTGPSLP